MEKIAVIMLACKDYESMEISLAAYAKNIKENHKLFILQNGRKTYDCERTLRVAERYEQLYPHNIEVITSIEPQSPYYAIKLLIDSDKLKDFDYICKVDDDVFPLHENWLEKLFDCYKKSKKIYGEKLAYVTPLINNNAWGFKEVLNIFELEKEFFANIARDHIVGNNVDPIEKVKIIPKNEIYTGWGGTVWANPYISRWVHEKTTLFPEKYLKLTENLGYKEVHNDKRYSINCMFFERDFWKSVENKEQKCGDEYLILKYCRKNDLKIIADLSNPFIHLLYWIQREENRDLIPKIRETYEKFLNLPYPIAVSPNKMYDIENRLRDYESVIQKLDKKYSNIEKSLLKKLNNEEIFLETLACSLNSNKKVLLWGASNFLRKISLKYQLKDDNIIGIVDIDSNKWGNKINNYKIYKPEFIKKSKIDTILVSIINNKDAKIDEIKEYLKSINRNDIEVI